MKERNVSFKQALNDAIRRGGLVESGSSDLVLDPYRGPRSPDGEPRPCTRACRRSGGRRTRPQGAAREVKIVDVNVMISAVNVSDARHEQSRAWIDAALVGNETVGFTWIAMLASCD